MGCKTNQEHAQGGNSTEIESGTCDGKGFTKESTCCHKHDYKKCPVPEKCDNHQDALINPSTTTTATTTKPSSNASCSDKNCTSEPLKEEPNNPTNTTPESKHTTSATPIVVSGNKTSNAPSTST